MVGKVPDCINSGKYMPMVAAGDAAGMHATPTIRINGEEYQCDDAARTLVAKIKEIVGDVPGIDPRRDPSGAVPAPAVERRTR